MVEQTHPEAEEYQVVLVDSVLPLEVVDDDEMEEVMEAAVVAVLEVDFAAAELVMVAVQVPGQLDLS